MKDDPSTPTTDGLSPNEFEKDKPGTSGQSRAEAAIEELRQRGGIFVEAVRATRMPMALTDPNLAGNPIVFANEAFLKLSGYRLDEVLGQQPHFMNGPGTDTKDSARFAEALGSGQDDIIETVQYRKNGSRFVATVLISAFKDDHGHTLNHFMSWLDVTRRVNAEGEVADMTATQAALQESEDRYRNLFESIDEGYLLSEVLFNERKEAVDILFLDANPAAVRIAGRDFTGQRMREIDPDYEQFWYESYGRVALTGEPLRAEHFAKPHGRWFDFRLARVGPAESRRVASVFQDITDRKDAEFALRASEERLRNVLEGMDEAFGLMDPDLRIITQKKAALEHLYGWEEGRASWLEMRAYPVPDGLAVFWRDISERKRAEEKLRESEERYRKLFETMDEAYAVVDVLKDGAGNWCDFRFVEVNPAFLEHTNMPPPVGKTATELLGTPNPRWTELYGRALDTGQPLRVEESEPTLGLTFDLNIFTLDREKNRVAVLFTNITERKQSEQALRESEERLREREADLSRVQRIGGVGGMDIHVAGGLTSRRSPEYLRLHGLSPEHAEESHDDWLARVHPDDREKAERAMFEALESGSNNYENQYRIIRPSDGEMRWIHARADIERDGDGKPRRIVGAHLDITESKLAAEALKASERHAQVLLGELQHRVRNTLAVVRSIARRTAELTDGSADFMSHFEGRLNAFSRVQAVVTRSATGGMGLESLVEDELLALATRQGEHLRVEGPNVCLTARAAESISLAIHELATNAVKYGALTVPDGRIRVNWRYTKDEAGADVLAFDWRESGLEAAPAMTREGFGHELLLRSLPYDLGATTEIAFEDRGLHFTMTLPLSPNVISDDASNSAR